MRKMIRRMILAVFVISLLGILTTCGAPAFAADETLTVTAAWVDGDMLHINVTDVNGDESSFEMRLSDYVSDADNKEYISIQAVDLMGNASAVFEIRNPNYVPIPPTDDTPIIVITSESLDTDEPSVSAIPPGGNPFTPDGTGTVIDNAHDGDGKEFFTIGTEDGNIFYLIIDRHRTTDNVYFLNAVTEEDLISLAQRSGREISSGGDTDGSISVIPTPEQPESPPTTTPEPEVEPPVLPPPDDNNSSMIIFVIIAAAAAGGAGYYFKIVKGRKNLYDDDEDDNESDDDYGYAEDDEDGDD